MPKIIEGLEKKILSNGRNLLLKEGYKKITMRQVAKECNVGIGTIYNYYSSKDDLIASIMIKDWVLLLDDSFISKCDSCINGLEIIYEKISSFSSTYRKTWKEYGNISVLTADRHHYLIEQLNQLIKPLFERFEIKNNDNLSVFISEVLLTGGTREDISYDMIKPFIIKLID